MSTNVCALQCHFMLCSLIYVVFVVLHNDGFTKKETVSVNSVCEFIIVNKLVELVNQTLYFSSSNNRYY